jgi:hypothetical protein
VDEIMKNGQNNAKRQDFIFTTHFLILHCDKLAAAPSCGFIPNFIMVNDIVRKRLFANKLHPVPVHEITTTSSQWKHPTTSQL